MPSWEGRKMKKDTFEKYLLLEQSGELSAWKKYRLACHLRKFPEAVEQKRALLQLLELSSSGEESTTPTETLTAVLGEARILKAEDRAAGRHSEKRLPAWGKVAGACAALALLMVAGMFLSSPRQSADVAQDNNIPNWEDSFESELDQLDTLIAMVESDMDDNDLDSLAETLLKMEGLEI